MRATDRKVRRFAVACCRRVSALVTARHAAVRPRPVCAAWLTREVKALADAIYAERAFDRMPLLADALEASGSDECLWVESGQLVVAPIRMPHNIRMHLHPARFAMCRTRLLFAIGVTLWSAVVAGSQAVPPTALSPALRDHVKDERFQIVTSVRGLPLGVRDALQTLFGSQTLDIADPGAEFQVTDVIVDSKLPTRRLVAAGCSIEYCLVYYERGGRAHTWYVALFHWTPAATRFEWGGTAPAGLATIDDVRNAVLSGAIKGPAGVW